DELTALDKDALVELVIRLHDRVTELEARVGRPPKGPGNSSVPPSQGFKANWAERRRKKRGPKCSHLRISRRRTWSSAVGQWRAAGVGRRWPSPASGRCGAARSSNCPRCGW